jgi:hypothetical protein
MSINTRDQNIAGMQAPINIGKNGSSMEAIGQPHSLFYTAGQLGAAAVPSPGINGAALTSYPGQIPFANPQNPALAYLGRAAISASQAGTLIIADRLWHNSGLVVTTTGAQAISAVAIPARDRNGAALGHDVQWALEVSTATTNGSPVTNGTWAYTDQDNNAGSGTIPNMPATATAGTFVSLSLGAGDSGARAPTSISLGTSYVTGAIHLVAYRELARLNVSVIGGFAKFDMPTDGKVQLFNDSVPFLIWVPTATAALQMTGHLAWSNG